MLGSASAANRSSDHGGREGRVYIGCFLRLTELILAGLHIDLKVLLRAQMIHHWRILNICLNMTTVGRYRLGDADSGLWIRDMTVTWHHSMTIRTSHLLLIADHENGIGRAVDYEVLIAGHTWLGMLRTWRVAGNVLTKSLRWVQPLMILESCKLRLLAEWVSLYIWAHRLRGQRLHAVVWRVLERWKHVVSWRSILLRHGWLDTCCIDL